MSFTRLAGLSIAATAAEPFVAMVRVDLFANCFRQHELRKIGREATLRSLSVTFEDLMRPQQNVLLVSASK